VLNRTHKKREPSGSRLFTFPVLPTIATLRKLPIGSELDRGTSTACASRCTDTEWRDRACHAWPGGCIKKSKNRGQNTDFSNIRKNYVLTPIFVFIDDHNVIVYRPTLRTDVFINAGRPGKFIAPMEFYEQLMLNKQGNFELRVKCKA
jgi:hypothetical protein